MKGSMHSAAWQETWEKETYASMLRASRGLTVQDIMSKEVITASSTDTIRHAAGAMSENHHSCLPVVDEGILKGILTQEEVLKEVVAPVLPADETTVGERMRSDDRRTSPDASVLDASWFMEEAKVKWLPVVAVDAATSISEAAEIMANENISCVVAMHNRKPVGVLTQTDVIGKVIAVGRAQENSW